MKRVDVKLLICILVLFSTFLVFSGSALAQFNFTGYTKYANGTNMSNVTVSLEITYWDGQGPPSTIATLSNLSNSVGFFNLTVNNTYDNESYFYRPSIIKYNGTSGDGEYAEYIGQSLPDFDSEMIAELGEITFYLKQAINVDLSVVGNLHEGDEISYSSSYSLGSSYGVGFDVVNESQLYNMTGGSVTTYSYVNGSDCLVILNSTRAVNLTFCDLNITDIVDLERYSWGNPSLGQNYSYYFANDTHLMQCYTSGDPSPSLNCSNLVELPADLDVQGIGIAAKESEDTYLFVSTYNSDDDHIVGKFYPNLTLIETYNITYGEPGKISSNSGYGTIYFAANNSELYQLYYCYLDSYNNLTCGPDDTYANFSEGEVVTGISNFGGQLIYTSSVSKNMTLISTETYDYQFMYQVKDSRLGYSVSEQWDNLLDSTTLYLPADRNYSLMIYPRNGPAFPATIEMNSLIEGNNISLGDTSATISSVDQGLYVNLSNANMSLEFNQFAGYVKWNTSASVQNFTNFTIIAYLFEGGNMVYKGGTLPANMGQWQEERVTDSFNLTSGRFNMTLPASVLGTDLLLFATGAVNNSGTLTYYGGFKDVTLTYGESVDEGNFTLYPLIGQESNITVGYETQSDASRFLTKQKTFNITSNGSAVDQAHVEIEVDYTSFSGSNLSFSWMAPVGSDDEGLFYLPVFNSTIKSVQIFSPNYAPLKKQISVSELQSNPVQINLSEFENKNPNGDAINEELIEMMLYINKDDGSCSVPYPDESCYAFDPDSEAEFNPFSVVLGGGKLDFEIKKTDNNITVRYINVDLLASGPPDAVFDEEANTSETGLEEAWRFGSLGPEIYDYVLIGVPYNTSAILAAMSARINITSFYGEDWDNPDWQMGIDDIDELEGTDYEDYAEGEYVNYTDGGGALCSTTDSNLTSSLCYRSTSTGMLWFKIPHFSGIGPDVVGEDSSTPDDDTPESSSSSRSSSAYWYETFNKADKELSEYGNIEQVLGFKEKLSFKLGGQTHSVGVLSVSAGSVTIRVESTPQEATLKLGETKQFDLNSDSIYDLAVTFNGAVNGKAKLVVSALNVSEKKLVSPVLNETVASELTDEGNKAATISLWVIGVVVLLVLVVVLIITKLTKKVKKHR